MSSIALRTEVPGPASRALARRRSEAVPRGVSDITSVYVASAVGATVLDVDGNTFLDFAGGIGCINAGHAPPTVTAAIQQQSERFLHTCFMVSPYEPYVALAERLNRLAPGDFSKRTFFVNTGAEAVENAIKIARSYTGKPGVICFDDAYHGRTYMAMALTAKDKPYKHGFGPFPDHVYRVPYANPYRTCCAVEKSMAALERLLAERSDLAALIVEPVEGEGGFVVPPPSFLRELRGFCDRHGLVMIADEIQTGFGRTGKLFASEHSGIAADLLLTAKSLASGMPLAAVTGREEIMNQPGPGAVGGTYGGNPVSCVAALATLELFADGDLLRRSEALGRRFQQRAIEWQHRFAPIGDVRGLGGMQAVELVLDRDRKTPAPELTRAIAGAALRRGLILVTAGTGGNVLRILVPLVASDDQMDEGLDIMEQAMEAAIAEHV